MFQTNEIDEKWAEHLADDNIRSLTLVGERRAGLSTACDEIVRAAFQRRGTVTPVIIQIDAQGLPSPQDESAGARQTTSRRFIEILAQLTTAAFPGVSSEVPPVADPGERLAWTLARAQRGGRPPLLVIDHFEYLMSRLDTYAWEILRSLVDQRKLQLLLLSRFIIREVDPLTGSRLFGVVPSMFILRPLPPPDRQQLAAEVLLQNGVATNEAVVAYIADLGGGWRWLTTELARIVAQYSSQLPAVTRATVDQAIGASRARVRDLLQLIAGWIAPERELDPILAMEMEREAAASFELLFAPTGLKTPLDPHQQRLQRLGHIEIMDNVFRFSSSLMRSLVLVRWRELRAAGAAIPANYAPWCEADELLRRWLRAHVPAASVAQLVADAGFADAVSVHDTARIWWGQIAGQDPLDELTADALIVVLRRAGFADAWCGRHDESLTQVGRARGTQLHAKSASLWGMNRRNQEEERLHALMGEIPRPASSPVKHRASPRKVVRWLHISDLHLGREQKPGEDYVLRTFLDSLQADMQADEHIRLGPPPDLVFFTGDLANRGTDEDYSRATELFDSILRILGLERRHLFLVPGNHDVHRPDTSYLIRDFDEDDLHKHFNDARWRRLYSERLGSFDRFVASYYAAVPERLQLTPLGFPRPQRVNLVGASLLLHLLNPLLSGGLDDDRGKLLLGLIARRAEFCEAEPADLTIALMHHPPDWLCPSDEQRFNQIIGTNVDFLLGGHVHRGEVRKTISTFGNLCELRAGALFQGDRWENTAQFAEFDIDTRELQVFPIKYNREGNRWVRDTRYGQYPSYTHREILKRRR